MNIPVELVRQILREATAVPGAFDTSLEGVLEEDERAMKSSIRTSMSCKRRLSRVCKEFHTLTEEFLYEIITVRKASRVPELIELLSRSRQQRPAAGWWCRRLEFHLLTRLYVAPWDEECSSIWKLFPLCPRVVHLRCSVKESFEGYKLHPLPKYLATYPVYPLLLVAIEEKYGASLRRLDLVGSLVLGVHAAERLLGCCSKLEVCHLGGLEAVNSWEDEELDPASESSSEEGESDEGESEEGEREEDGTSADEATDDSASVLSSDVEVDDIVLPLLHTLKLTCPSHLSEIGFRSRIHQWTAPSLRALTAGISEKYGTQMSRSLLEDGLKSHVSLSRLTYEGHSFDMGTTLSCLPDLQHLTLCLCAPYQDTELGEPHGKLSTVVVVPSPRASYKTLNRDLYVPWLRNVVLLKETGKFPALRVAQVGSEPSDVTFDVEIRSMIKQLKKVDVRVKFSSSRLPAKTGHGGGSSLGY